VSRRTACITDRQRQRFLDELALAHTITHAARAAGIGRQTVYELRQRDETFALAWADAIEAGSDFIEEEVRRRAVEGTEKPIMYQGEVVAHVREFSDRLIELELKARRPQKYRENIALELSGSLAPSAEELAAAREAGKDEEAVRAAALLAKLPHVRAGNGAHVGNGSGAADPWAAEDQQQAD
jgi:hypothetical protein